MAAVLLWGIRDKSQVQEHVVEMSFFLCVLNGLVDPFWCSVVALGKLLEFGVKRNNRQLWDIAVKGEELVSESKGIRTRSMARNAAGQHRQRQKQKLQMDKHVDRQMDEHTDKQMDKHVHRQMDEHTQTNR